jgi:hypothetical protein
LTSKQKQKQKQEQADPFRFLLPPKPAAHNTLLPLFLSVFLSVCLSFSFHTFTHEVTMYSTMNTHTNRFSFQKMVKHILHFRFFLLSYSSFSTKSFFILFDIFKGKTKQINRINGSFFLRLNL